MNETADDLIRLLDLAPHPEGGFFRETFRSDLEVDAHAGKRSASTAIYFLLRAGEFSALHRVRSDELWHFYGGDPIEISILDDAGTLTRQMLGNDISRGNSPQIVVPRNHWQAARCLGKDHSLAGCTVAPGFSFADFEMPSRAELVARFPAHAELVSKLTR